MATEPSWSDGGEGGHGGGELMVRHFAPTRFHWSQSSCRVSVGFIMWSFKSGGGFLKISDLSRRQRSIMKGSRRVAYDQGRSPKHFHHKPYNVAIQFISLLQGGTIKMHCGGVGWGGSVFAHLIISNGSSRTSWLTICHSVTLSLLLWWGWI